VEKNLNSRSGLLGLSGASADIRDVLRAAASPDGSSAADQAAQVYLWRIRKYLGSYLAVVGQPQAVIFTDTIGETVPLVRWAVCSNMETFGLVIDAERNAAATVLPVDVATAESRVRILVIATNEELSIARSTYAVLTGHRSKEDAA
jgi:acetate kinase